MAAQRLFAAILLMAAPLAGAAASSPTLLVVSVTKGYRHESIPTAERVLRELGRASGAFALDFARTDDELRSKTTRAALEAYAGVVFASTTGDIPLADPQGFVDWVAAGHAFVGIHSATDTLYGFPPYVDMVGAKFRHHGPQAEVKVTAKDPGHPATAGLPDSFSVFDEIYQFERFDPARVRVLLSLDRHPETGAPGEFPLAWTREHGRGRVFYTALGHRDDVLERGFFREHLLGGIRWALQAVAAPAGVSKLLSHDVYFTLHDDSPAAREALVAACREHLSGHPGSVGFRAGTRAGEMARDVNDRDFGVALHVLFRDRAAHDAYQVHPRHLAFIEKMKANWKTVRVFDSWIAPEAAGEEAAWTPLFNGRDLAGWDKFLSYQPESGSQTTLGVNNDPKGVFSVVDGTIRVSGEIWGGLTTQQEFENYALRLEYKWGEKKWPPRLQARRDSGVLYHAVGPHGAQSGHWMRSFESQVQEHDSGDFHSLDGVTIDLEAAPVELDGEKLLQYRPGAPVVEGVKQRVVKLEDAERPTGDWNTMEIVARGDTVEHRVNGRTVLRAKNLRQVVDGQRVPLTRGKLQLQSEGAEVFYRNIEIRPLR